MRTKYTIKPAHSGTTDQEIAKAKRDYRKGVKNGEFRVSDHVLIRFDDVNYNITTRFVCMHTFYPLD